MAKCGALFYFSWVAVNTDSSRQAFLSLMFLAANTRFLLPMHWQILLLISVLPPGAGQVMHLSRRLGADYTPKRIPLSPPITQTTGRDLQCFCEPTQLVCSPPSTSIPLSTMGIKNKCNMRLLSLVALIFTTYCITQCIKFRPQHGG